MNESEQQILDAFEELGMSPQALSVTHLCRFFNVAGLVGDQQLKPTQVKYIINKGHIDSPPLTSSGYKFRLKHMAALLDLLQDRTGHRYSKEDQQWDRLKSMF